MPVAPNQGAPNEPGETPQGQQAPPDQYPPRGPQGSPKSDQGRVRGNGSSSSSCRWSGKGKGHAKKTKLPTPAVTSCTSLADTTPTQLSPSYASLPPQPSSWSYAQLAAGKPAASEPGPSAHTTLAIWAPLPTFTRYNGVYCYIPKTEPAPSENYEITWIVEATKIGAASRCILPCHRGCHAEGGGEGTHSQGHICPT